MCVRLNVRDTLARRRVGVGWGVGVCAGEPAGAGGRVPRGISCGGGDSDPDSRAGLRPSLSAPLPAREFSGTNRARTYPHDCRQDAGPLQVRGLAQGGEGAGEADHTPILSVITAVVFKFLRFLSHWISLPEYPVHWLNPKPCSTRHFAAAGGPPRLCSVYHRPGIHRVRWV